MYIIFEDQFSELQFYLLMKKEYALFLNAITCQSVERQLQRGREAREHNSKVRETGIGSLKEERPTDYNEELARRRYAVFKSHYSTLVELKKIFPFSVINTKASVMV